MKFDKLRLLTDAAEYARKGKVDRAIEAYRTVLTAQPDEVRAQLKIGDLLARENSDQEAADTYLLVADHYAERGFSRKAIAVYRRVLELQPHRLDVHLQLAEALRELGLQGDVRAVLNTALQALDESGPLAPLEALRAMVTLDPENVSLRLRLADLLTEQNQRTEAAETLEDAAQQLRTAGQPDAFLLVNEKRLALQPDNTPLRRELAGVYLRRDMPQRALEILQHCYNGAATEPTILTLLVKVFLALGRDGEAITCFKALAEAHEQSGQSALRDGALRNVLKLDPEDEDALAALDLAPPAQARPEPEPLAPEPEPQASEREPRAREPEPSQRDSGRFGSVDLTDAIDALVTQEKTGEQLTMWLEEARVFVEFGLVRDARRQLELILAEEPEDAGAKAMLSALDAPPSDEVSPVAQAAPDATAEEPTRASADLAGFLEPNWLEPELVVDLD